MSKIKVALVSFYLNTIVNQDNLLIKDIEKDFSNFKNIILNSDYNLIIFPGWSLNKNKLADLKVFIELPENQEKLQNKLVIFEVYDNENNKYKDNENFKDIIKKKDIIEKDEENKEEDKKRLIYIIEKGVLIKTGIIQLFHKSSTATEQNIKLLYEEINNSIEKPENTNRRVINFMDKNILILVCGELYFLHNHRNKVIIRHLNEPNNVINNFKKLMANFNEILKKISIKVNIIHTPFKIKYKKNDTPIDYNCYRKYLSENNNYYLSTCNNYINSGIFEIEKDLQYIFKDGEIQRLTPVNPEIDYFLQTYDIE